MAGIVIYGADGTVRLDGSNSICRVVGNVFLNGTDNGAVSIPDGRLWFTTVMIDGYDLRETEYLYTISGLTLSWSTLVSPATPQNLLLIYGAY